MSPCRAQRKTGTTKYTCRKSPERGSAAWRRVRPESFESSDGRLAGLVSRLGRRVCPVVRFDHLEPFQKRHEKTHELAHGHALVLQPAEKCLRNSSQLRSHADALSALSQLFRAFPPVWAWPPPGQPRPAAPCPLPRDEFRPDGFGHKPCSGHQAIRNPAKWRGHTEIRPRQPGP